MRGKRAKRIFGGALGLVLAVAALALLAAFTAATVSIFSLHMASGVANESIADGLADSAVQEAMAHLQEDLGFDEDITIGPGLGLPDGSKGRLTFKKKGSEPYSTNNFLGDNPDGWKRTLPEKTVHLIGVGESGGSRRYVEAVVHVPEYPVSAACSGPVRVKNSLIAGFEPEDDRPWQPGTGYDTEESELGPGHLVTNSNSPDSVVLDNKTRITGDVQSRGGVALNGATVEGEVRASWGGKAPLPDFNIDDFDPKASEDLYFEELTAVPSTATLVGNVRYDGDLIMTGDLTLDNAFLFVNGNVKILGQVKGVGAIVARGAADFTGAVDVSSSDQIALLSRGGITLEGESSSRNVFRGLLYTQGPFSGKKVTIVGSFIVDNGQPTLLEDASVFQSQENQLIKIRRETAAVIPRFYVPSNAEIDADLTTDPQTGQPKGPWAKGQDGYFMAGRPHVKRTIANVWDINNPNWSRSDWNQLDPAVVRVKWVGNEPVFTYQFWGHLENSGYLDDANPIEIEPFTFDQLVDTVANQNTASNVSDNLDGTVPNRAQYAAYLQRVLNHIQSTGTGSEGFNFSIDPNEFISEGDRIRVLLYRRF